MTIYTGIFIGDVRIVANIQHIYVQPAEFNIILKRLAETDNILYYESDLYPLRVRSVDHIFSGSY